MYETLLARRSPARTVAVVTVAISVLALRRMQVHAGLSRPNFQSPELVYKLSQRARTGSS